MPSEINLLPKELTSSKEAVSTSRLLTRLTIACGSVLVVSALAGGGLLYYLSSQASELEIKQQELVTGVENLESTEQKLVLIKDRVSKIDSVLSERQKYELIDKYRFLAEQLPEGAALEEVQLDTDLSNVTLIIPSSVDLERILEQIAGDSRFTRIRINSLDYNPSSGYELVLDLL